MDNRSKDARSRNMARILSKDTCPEEIVRKYLFCKGFRYRKNVSSLPGRPDIVLPKFKTVIFVNGCFWHAHKNCKWFVKPKSNQEFWENKFAYNVARDEKNHARLIKNGWRVLVVWECEIRHGNKDICLQRLVEELLHGYSNK